MLMQIAIAEMRRNVRHPFIGHRFSSAPLQARQDALPLGSGMIVESIDRADEPFVLTRAHSAHLSGDGPLEKRPGWSVGGILC